MKWISAILLVLIASYAPAQTINPKLVLKKGQQFERIISVKSQMFMALMGMDQEMTNDITSYLTVTVKEVNDAGYMLESKLTRQVITIIAMGINQHFDSDSTQNIEDTLLGNRLMADVGKVTRIVISRQGKIISSADTIQLSEETSGMGALSGLVNYVKRPGQQYELIAQLPAGPQKAGKEWSDSVDIEGNKELANFKLETIGKDEAVISQQSKISNNVEFSRGGGVTTVLKTDGTSKGQASIDPRTGILKESKSTIEATGSFEVAGHSIPVRMKSENSQVVKERQP